MWIFRGILFVVLLVVLVWFFVDNSNQSVDIKFFSKSYLGISIYWVVVISFLVGFATSFILAAFREFRFHRVIGQLKRDAGSKDSEIAGLRTLPLKNMNTGDSGTPNPEEVRGD